MNSQRALRTRRTRPGALGVLLFLALGAFGCAAASTTVLECAPLARVDSDDGAILVLPAAGSYGGKVYEGSGFEVARHARKALLRRLKRVDTIARTTVEAARQVCVERGARFLLMPEIHHWEDHARPWPGRVDVVEIDLVFIDVEGQASRKLRFVAKSSWFTFVNTPVLDLLGEEFERAVLSLLRTSAAPR